MPIVNEIERFVFAHRACGVSTGDATAPTRRGYLLWISCPCGERFERWVTPTAAESDLTALGFFGLSN